jgi:hypothetical protein
MGVSGQLHDIAVLPQGKSPQYPLVRKLGGPQSHYGYDDDDDDDDGGGGEKNSHPPLGIKP